MLVLGGGKARTIEADATLKWISQRFRDDLCQGNSILVIGYSFGDEHINASIIDAVTQHGLRFFVVDPHGSDVVRRANGSYGGAVYDPNTSLVRAFRAGLVGASRRPLTATFGDDTVSFENVTRFLA